MHATSKTYKNLALFDFDGTLCKKDSFTGFIFYALSKRHIVKQGFKILPVLMFFTFPLFETSYDSNPIILIYFSMLYVFYLTNIHNISHILKFMVELFIIFYISHS